jgi:hypothetical protein
MPPPLSQSATAIFKLLCELGRLCKGQIYPTYDWFIEKTGFARATVARAIAQLKEAGFLLIQRRCKRVERDGPGPRFEQTSNAYRLEWPTGLDRWLNATQADAFRDVRKAGQDESAAVEHVRALVDSGDVASALREAVRGRLNILISGGTSSGKTTFLGALIREIPTEEPLVLIEDTPEIKLTHENAVGLIAARSAIGEAAVTANDLVSASLRMRPDRIILGELRGPEAFAFLRAINTGHPGSMTTIHADSTERAFEQLALLVLEGGSTLQRADILAYVRTTVDVVVQLSRGATGRSVAGISARREQEKA